MANPVRFIGLGCRPGTNDVIALECTDDRWIGMLMLCAALEGKVVFNFLLSNVLNLCKTYVARQTDFWELYSPD